MSEYTESRNIWICQNGWCLRRIRAEVTEIIYTLIIRQIILKSEAFQVIFLVQVHEGTVWSNALSHYFWEKGRTMLRRKGRHFSYLGKSVVGSKPGLSETAYGDKGWVDGARLRIWRVGNRLTITEGVVSSSNRLTICKKGQLWWDYALRATNCFPNIGSDFQLFISNKGYCHVPVVTFGFKDLETLKLGTISTHVESWETQNSSLLLQVLLVSANDLYDVQFQVLLPESQNKKSKPVRG